MVLPSSGLPQPIEITCSPPSRARAASASILDRHVLCDRLVVLRAVSPHEAKIVFDGDGRPAWEQASPMRKNGQRTISLARLRRIAASGCG
jgi:hypothetical protein